MGSRFHVPLVDSMQAFALCECNRRCRLLVLPPFGRVNGVHVAWTWDLRAYALEKETNIFETDWTLGSFSRIPKAPIDINVRSNFADKSRTSKENHEEMTEYYEKTSNMNPGGPAMSPWRCRDRRTGGRAGGMGRNAGGIGERIVEHRK